VALNATFSSLMPGSIALWPEACLVKRHASRSPSRATAARPQRPQAPHLTSRWRTAGRGHGPVDVTGRCPPPPHSPVSPRVSQLPHDVGPRGRTWRGSSRPPWCRRRRPWRSGWARGQEPGIERWIRKHGYIEHDDDRAVTMDTTLSLNARRGGVNYIYPFRRTGSW
jgi:hypothetical protein